MNLDVCGGCSGLWFDTGELELLSKDRSQAARVREKSFPSRGQLESEDPEASDDAKAACHACGREVRRVLAFVRGSRMYCGSCCPKGSAPVYRSKITPGLRDELDRPIDVGSTWGDNVEDTLVFSSILSTIVGLFTGVHDWLSD